MAEQKKQSMVRKYIQTWRSNAEQKAELREAEKAQKVGISLWVSRLCSEDNNTAASANSLRANKFLKWVMSLSFHGLPYLVGIILTMFKYLFL
jgi:hypothetical protein